MPFAAALVALAAQTPAAEPDGWRRFHGAGASLEVAPESIPGERVRGEAYVLEIQREIHAAERPFPLLRVAIFAGAPGTLEGAAERWHAEDVARLRAEGFEPLASAPLRAAVAGAERDGTRTRCVDASGGGWELDEFLIPLGSQLASVTARSALPPAAEERRVLERMLRTLALRELAGTEPIMLRLGPTGVRLPGLHAVEPEWEGEPATGSLQVRLAEGALTVFARDCRTAGAARDAEAFTFAEFVHRARRDAEASGGALELEGHAAGLIVAGERVLPFQRMALRAGSERHEVLAAVVRDGTWILALQLAAAPDQLAGAESRFRQLLAGLDLRLAGPPVTRQVAGRGLRFLLPGIFRLGAYPAPQAVLQASAAHPQEADLPTLFFAWRGEPPADLHESYCAEFFPHVEPSWSGRWLVPSPLGTAAFRVSVLGPQGEAGLLATATRAWSGGSLTVVLRLPHARNAVQAQEVLARVLGSAGEFGSGHDVTLRAGRAWLALADGERLGWEASTAAGEEIVVATAWGELHLGLRERSGAESAGGPELQRLARGTLEELMSENAEAWSASGVRVEEWVELPGFGRTARVRQELEVDGRQGALVAYAASVPGAWLRVWAFTAEALDGAVRADLDALLAAAGCDPLVD